MILITINGKKQECAEGASLAGIVSTMKLEGRLAVEVNLDIIPRSAYANTILKQGDNIEIVQAIGGG